MSDTTGNTTQSGGDPTVVTPATGESLPVATAAAVLGITSDAIRARIRRGKLQGEKRGGAWFVYVSNADRPDSDTTGPDTHNAGATTDTTANTSVATGIVDLAPLAGLIERQGRELTEARAAATLWQERARVLEGRLLQLTAGTTEPETTGIVPGPPVRDETPATGLVAWWRRLLGRE